MKFRWSATVCLEKKAKEIAEYVKCFFHVKNVRCCTTNEYYKWNKRISTGFWKTVAVSLTFSPRICVQLIILSFFSWRAYRRCRIIVREISTNCLVTNACAVETLDTVKWLFYALFCLLVLFSLVRPRIYEIAWRLSSPSYLCHSQKNIKFIYIK